MESKRIRLLLTNDDGALAPGLFALGAALAESFEVTVLVPGDERSGVAHSVSLFSALGVRQLPSGLGLSGFAITGTPVDCVKLAIGGVLVPAPEIVVAGMNDGHNTGVTVYTSGTASAAREAAIHGLPSFAVSTARPSVDIEGHARLAASIVTRIARQLDRPPGVFYNINLPSRPAGEIAGLRVTRQCLATFTDQWEQGPSAGGQSTFRLKGGHRPPETDIDIDTGAVASGWVSITPLTINATDTRSLIWVANSLDLGGAR